jgi:hypothetical protein
MWARRIYDRLLKPAYTGKVERDSDRSLHGPNIVTGTMADAALKMRRQRAVSDSNPPFGLQSIINTTAMPVPAGRVCCSLGAIIFVAVAL